MSHDKLPDSFNLDEINDDMSDFEVMGKISKARHKERVNKNGDRIGFAEDALQRNEIEYSLKNAEIGHFHAYRKSDGKLFQFWAGTGKIMGIPDKRGIHAFVTLLNK